MNQPSQPNAVITARPTFWRRHLRLLVGIAVFVLLVVIYVYAALTMLPQWLVSMTAGKADPDTQLNAVTNTRTALLGIVTPIAVLVGGIAAFLNYQETAEQNRRTNELARRERDETSAQNSHVNEMARLERDEIRRVRRATVYADLLRACNDCVDAAEALHYDDPPGPDYLLHLRTNLEMRTAMDVAHDRVMLLGSDAVQASAQKLDLHCGVEIATKANFRPRLSSEEWTRIRITEYVPLSRAFMDAARDDLAPTR